MYLAPRLNWSGNVLGGLMFGFGMVFAGGCASRNLVRAGGGDLRALVTLLFIGIFAYMAIGGVLGPARAGLEQASSLDLNALAAETQASVTFSPRSRAPRRPRRALPQGSSLALPCSSALPIPPSAARRCMSSPASASGFASLPAGR